MRRTQKTFGALLLVYFLIALLVMPPWTTTVQAAYSFVNQAYCFSGDDETCASSAGSGAIDTTGVDLIVACLAINDSPAESSPTFVDNKSNTFTRITDAVSTGGSDDTRSALYYVQAPSVGSGHTFTYDANALNFPSMIIWTFSGSVSSPLDQQAQDGAATDTINVGPVTPSENNELLVTCLTHKDVDVGAPSIDDGFTGTASIQHIHDAFLGIGMARKIHTTAGTEEPTWTVTADEERLASIIATFKTAGGAAATCVPLFTLLGITFGC